MAQRYRRRAKHKAPSPLGAFEPVGITQLVAGGDGFGRLRDGTACFVAGAFTGDVVVPQQLERRSSLAHCGGFELLVRSPARVTAACPHVGPCGGCNWLELAYDEQLRAKVDILHTALLRLAKVPWPIEKLTICPSPQRTEYRSRARLQIDDAMRLCLLGRKSHRAVPIDHCLVLTPALQEAMRALQNVLSNCGDAFIGLKQVELRCLDAAPSLEVFGHRLSKHARQLLQREGFFLGVEGEQRHQVVNVGGGTLQLATDSFSQVNSDINSRLIAEVCAGAAKHGVRTFLDLCCGAGNFALPLLRAGLSGLGVDAAESSLAGARAQAARENLVAGTFAQEDLMSALERLQAEGASYDLVVADPPRRGLGPAATIRLARVAAKHVFLCYCDPATFARDLAILIGEGFELRSVRAWDMFPQTHHFESSAWLTRS